MRRRPALLVLKGHWLPIDINNWLQTFQLRSDELCGNNALQFTCDIWVDNKKEIDSTAGLSSKISLVKSNKFPYLDLAMFWADNDKIQFEVYMKENQELRYLNQDSSHTKSCLEAIPFGVLNRLAKLTSPTRRNKEMRINSIYPGHAKALETAGLAPAKYPKLRTLLNRLKEKKKENNTDRAKKYSASRNTYFCVGFSKVFTGRNSIHVKIKKLRNKYNLKWLRLKMSYHKFSNLREILQGDLTSKLISPVQSLHFKDRPCNCKTETKADGKCILRRKLLQTPAYTSMAILHPRMNVYAQPRAHP